MVTVTAGLSPLANCSLVAEGSDCGLNVMDVQVQAVTKTKLTWY